MIRIWINRYYVHNPMLKDEARIVHSPHLRIELNRPDVLTFTLPPNNRLFGKIQKRKHIVQVKNDNEEIFRGQVIDERPNINNMIEYTCEGMLSYLEDSIQRPYKIEEDAEIPVTELFGRLIANHNAQVETEKQFTVGIVDATDKLIHTDSTDFATTLHEINLLCIGRYGGYLRVRRENNINYIDWLKELTDVCTQTVEFGENIIDIDGLIDTREVGSVLIPLGAQTKGKKLTIADVNGGSDSIESAELIQKYGRVVVTRDFPTIKDANELLNKGREALSEMEDDETFDITAVDLSCLGVDVSALRVGLLTPIRAPNHGINKNKILYAADMDLANIENSVYTFGVPRQTLTEVLAETARGGGAAGKKIEELKDIITDAYIDIDRLNGEILLRAYQDEMNERFSEAWIDINGAKADLLLKADQETVDELSRTVTQAQIDIDGAKADILLKADKTYVEDLEKTVNQAQIDIDGANAAILLKADTSTVNALGERVSSAEVAIDGAKSDILLKADKTYVEDLEETVNQAQIDINGAKADILLKADQKTVDELSSTVSQAVVDINGAKADILLKANQSTVDELSSTVSQAQIDINGAKADILLKADKTYVEDLESTVSQAQIDINGAKADILLKADQKTVDELSSTVSQAQIDINGAKADILLKADKTYVEGIESTVSQAVVDIDGAKADILLKADKTDVEGLEKDVSQAIIDINGAKADILLKADKTYVEGIEEDVSQAQIDINGAKADILLKADKTYVEGIESTVSQAVVDINAANAAISLKAEQSSVNALDNRVSSAEIAINGANSRIDLKADETYVDNLFAKSITAENLSASLSNLNAIVNDSIQGNTGDFETVIAQGVQIGASGGLSVGGLNYSTHSHKVSVNEVDGTVTLGEVSATGGNFRIADTQYYKNGVSAAKESVTATLSGWSTGTNTVTLSNGKPYPVSLPDFTANNTVFDETTHKATVHFYTNEIPNAILYSHPVDASSVYEQGLADGGDIEITLSESGWKKNINTVSAKSGDTVIDSIEITAPTLTPEYYDFDAENKLRMLVWSEASVFPQLDFTIDASSVYEKGEDSVTISQSGWDQNRNTVTATNGERETVYLPEFETTGGTSFDSNHITKVYFMTKSLELPVKTATVDASSVYEEGYAAGWAAAKAMIRHDQTDKRLFFGPGSTVDTEEQIYKITVAAELNGPRNSAPSIVTASATARVYLDGTQILNDIKTNDLTINSGML